MKRRCDIVVLKILGLLTVVALFLAPAARAETNARETNGLSFLDGMTLVVLEDGDIPAMHEAKELITAYGGRVAIMSPPSMMLGWIPFERRSELVGRAGIKDIYYTEVLPGDVETYNEPNRAVLAYFNAAVRGEIEAEHDTFEALSSGARDDSGGRDRAADLRVPPGFDRVSYEENLVGAGLDIDRLKERGLYPEGISQETAGNSDAMTGTIAVSIFFIESDGTGSDPDLYTWTVEHMQKYINSAITAMAWWSNRALGHAGCAATWLLYYYSGADPRCQQWTEPILHDTSYEDIWVKAIMSNFGFTSGTRWSRVDAFNTWQRSTYQTARAFCAFIPYNPDGPAAFPDGHTAYAYYYGPYHVCLFNTGWTQAQTFAHETGHIFGACDEYAGGCSYCGTCTNGVDNGNCEVCNPRSVNCMMKANSWALCTFTPGHVGWELVPCTPSPPPALPAPSVAVSYPAQLYQGLSGTITVGGENFYAGAWVDFGDEVFVDRTTLVGAESLIVDVTVLNTAPPGFYDITVRNRDFQEATLAGALEILPTTRHYYSPAGGDNFPYITPQDAAVLLDDAISAGYGGDTLFVPTGALDLYSLQLEKGVLLHGAWSADFTTRDLAGGKTALNLIGNISIFEQASKGGLDGFIIENGEGAYTITPFVGYTGGGVRILDAEATIANCEIRFNAASDGTALGAGGGIYAQNAVVDIRDNIIHDNTATWGGAVYMTGCRGTITGNTITGNTVTASTGSPYGAGIYLTSCDSVAVAGNTIDANTGAQNGGGILVAESSRITVSGGVVSNNPASFQGGGLCVDNADLELAGADVDGNTAAVGGGIGASGASSIDVSECRFTQNSASVGGAVYSTAGFTGVSNNLFVGNSTTGPAGAVYVANAASGEVAANTFDGNAAGGGAGGILASNTSIELFNNVVVNSTGHGIAASGTVLPWTGYNLVWNSSGNDYDGVGSGDGAVTGDPLFVDAPSGDYHLGPHSPAIDAGRPGASYDDLDGSRGDAGLYGYRALVMDRPSYTKNLMAGVQSGNLILEWDRNPETDIDRYAVYQGSESGFKPSASNFVTYVSSADTSANVGAPGDSAYYVVSAVDSLDYAGGYSNEVFVGPASGTGETMTYRNRLHQNVPNPFNPATKIRYELQTGTHVSLVVYDVGGRTVRRLAGGYQSRGDYTVTWDGTNDAGGRVSSGIYFYRLEAGTFTQVRKMLMLK